jgi:hypothetical protein
MLHRYNLLVCILEHLCRVKVCVSLDAISFEVVLTLTLCIYHHATTVFYMTIFIFTQLIPFASPNIDLDNTCRMSLVRFSKNLYAFERKLHTF